MQITLTDGDLKRMPAWLRRDFLLFLALADRTSRGVEPEPAEQLAILDRAQALALIRNVSFGGGERVSHDLLRALAYEKDDEAPTVNQLISQLDLKNEQQLRDVLNGLTRLVRLVTHDPAAQFARLSGPDRGFVVHPISRDILRNAFAILGRSGEQEEPLWE